MGQGEKNMKSLKWLLLAAGFAAGLYGILGSGWGDGGPTGGSLERHSGWGDGGPG